MIFIPQHQIDQWLLEDIQGGDLTTRALGIGDAAGLMTFAHRQGGCVSGIVPALHMLRTLGLDAWSDVRDGDTLQPGQPLLQARGSAEALHQGWKAVQNVLEWSCGVSGYLARMLTLLRQHVPDGQIACTRKAIPGTRLLAMQAVLAAGGIIHRAGCAETVLLFANHRRFWQPCEDWQGMIQRLRMACPEKKIVVEADTPDEARDALLAGPDVLQLDKFTPEQARDVAELARGSSCTLAVAGGITLGTLPDFLSCGIKLFITSSPYYASPADISVTLTAV
ncbi:ModD protein [Phytobacter sp. V91]|uniref:ModD protein n=1 Tax=Phytobacter sp. V91 TaxID=3369425 RepID=UPI003F635AD8